MYLWENVNFVQFCFSVICLLLYEYLQHLSNPLCLQLDLMEFRRGCEGGNWKRKSRNRAEEGELGGGRQGVGCIGPPKCYKAGTASRFVLVDENQ